METIYESASETAKKVRKELKRVFPESKFSVRSSTYSMGSSIRVEHKSGKEPERSEVISTIEKFKSSSFDGMQDMKISTGYMYEGKRYNGADYIFYN